MGLGNCRVVGLTALIEESVCRAEGLGFKACRVSRVCGRIGFTRFSWLMKGLHASYSLSSEYPP